MSGIIDPRGDLECSSLSDEVNKTLLQFSKVTSKWTGLNGADHTIRLVNPLGSYVYTLECTLY